MSSSTAVKAPIVFTAADMKIEVFTQVFHVNSVVLKIHSEFFRTFLDSADKTQKLSPGGFKYDWVTEIDNDGSGWILTASEKSTSTGKNNKFQGLAADEIKAFETMMKAIYGQSISFLSVEEFLKVADIADIYRALPIVSAAITGALFTSPVILSSLPTQSSTIICAANKLRHKLLFKESLIHILGPWGNPQYKNHDDFEIQEVAESVDLKLRGRLYDLQQALLHLQYHISSFHRISSMSIFGVQTPFKPSVIGTDGYVMMPKFYRVLSDLDKQCECKQASQFTKKLGAILENNLFFDKSGVSVGKGIYEDTFLCFDIDDDDLPWDVDETTW